MPQSPQVPSGARANALMSSQWSRFWSDGLGLPTQFGRSLPRTACSEEPRLSVTVMGNPERAWKIPLSFQPPRIAFIGPDQLLPHLRPLPQGRS